MMHGLDDQCRITDDLVQTPELYFKSRRDTGMTDNKDLYRDFPNNHYTQWG